METVVAGSRQSDALPPFNYLDVEKIKREGPDYQQRHPSMAALNMSHAPLMSPTAMYSGPPPPYSYPSTTASSAPGLPGLISPPESRRTSGDEKEPRPPHRHSLPSIHEALSGDQHLVFTAPPSVTTVSHPDHTSSSTVTPSTPIPRSHPEPSHLGAPSLTARTPTSTTYVNQAHQAPSSYTQNSPYIHKNTLPTSRYSAASALDSKLPSLPSLRTAPSQTETVHPPPGHQSRYSPPREYVSRPTNSMNPHYGYGHYPPHYTYSSQPPPPPHSGPSPTYHSPTTYHHSSNSYPTWRSDGAEINRAEEGRKTAPRGTSQGGQAYGESVKRHLDIFDLETSLNEIAEGSGQILDFSRHYGARAHQTQRSGPIPGSTPTLSECEEMLRQHNRVHDSLYRIRDVLVTQQHVLAESRAQDQGYKGSSEYDGDDSYHDDSKGGGGFAGADAKKRRGVDVTVVIVQRRQNGGEDRMVLGRSATLAVYVRDLKCAMGI
ncbi:MAG: hypothetical protein M1836_006906 [Candelina mexicana]|nr:MAG: hypothetical protein M1836_006906 [Candelina mexicana]